MLNREKLNFAKIWSFYAVLFNLETAQKWMIKMPSYEFFTEFCLLICSSERGEGSRLNNPDSGFFEHHGSQPFPTG